MEINITKTISKLSLQKNYNCLKNIFEAVVGHFKIGADIIFCHLGAQATYMEQTLHVSSLPRWDFVRACVRVSVFSCPVGGLH